MRIGIIGAGIGGLTSAIALVRGGHEVTVYERTEQLSEVGAGITLWCNATAALADIGAGHIPTEIGYPIDRAETLNISGKPLVTVDVSSMDNWMGTPSVVVHRRELQQALLEMLPAGTVRLGKECIGVGTTGSIATAKFADETETTVDVLIGADGIRSIVRAAVTNKPAIRYAGYVAWRGVCDWDWPDDAPASTHAAGRGSQWGLFRLTENRAYWFVTANSPSGETSDDHQTSALACLTGWADQFRAPILATHSERVLRDDIHDLVRIPRWQRGRCVLVGDAAHATTPNLGQGACQAIEDAPAIASTLTDVASVEDALRFYEGRRKPRADQVVALSKKFGRRAQRKNRLLTALRNKVAQSAPGYVQREFERIPTGHNPSRP